MNTLNTTQAARHPEDRTLQAPDSQHTHLAVRRRVACLALGHVLPHRTRVGARLRRACSERLGLTPRRLARALQLALEPLASDGFFLQRCLQLGAARGLCAGILLGGVQVPHCILHSQPRGLALAVGCRPPRPVVGQHLNFLGGGRGATSASSALPWSQVW